MAPSLFSLGTAALALAGNAAAVQWYLEDTYNSTNFFDKFEFETMNDPNTGYVNYLSRKEAVDAGLATIKNNEVILRVDNKSKVQPDDRGRGSVRLESKARLNQGLMIARFSHLPQSACGTWPAFWTVGEKWVEDGEIDIFENWNLRGVNNPAYHMANKGDHGNCKIEKADQAGKLITANCDNQFSDGKKQWPNQGCVVEDKGPLSGGGGVYAMEWTSEFIKVYSWFPNQVPSNIGSSSPDTSLWGPPTMYLKKDLCNIDRIFKPQRIVLNIALCGNPVDTPSHWGKCQEMTGQSCRDFVANNPSAFDNVYFQVQDIRLFNQDAPKTTTANTSKEKTVATSSANNTSTWRSSNSTLSTASGSAGSASISITPKASGSTVPTISTQVPVSFSTSVPSLSTRWPNSTIASSVEMTTSTVYTTSTRTITSCQPTVTNCPVGKVTTMTVPLFITICPVSPVKTNTPGPKPTQTPANSGIGSDKTTITTKLTKTFTITSCAPTITNCPVGKVTTEVFTTTYCPDEEKAAPTGSHSDNNDNNGNGGNGGNNSNNGNGDNNGDGGNNGNSGNGGKGSDKTAITTKVTDIYTITSCAPTITNCPVGKVTTEVVASTYYPGEETHSTGATDSKGGFTSPSPFHPSKTSIYNTQAIVPVPQPFKPSGGNNITSDSTSIIITQSRPSGSQVCVGPSCSAEPSSPPLDAGSKGCTGPDCPPTAVSGADKQSLSALVVLGAVAAMML